MIFLWFSYGFPMDFLWFSHGFPKKAMFFFTCPGVDDLYTDPQIHTASSSSSTRFGRGNMGLRGMALFFASHRCWVLNATGPGRKSIGAERDQRSPANHRQILVLVDLWVIFQGKTEAHILILGGDPEFGHVDRSILERPRAGR